MDLFDSQQSRLIGKIKNASISKIIIAISDGSYLSIGAKSRILKMFVNLFLTKK